MNFPKYNPQKKKQHKKDREYKEMHVNKTDLKEQLPKMFMRYDQNDNGLDYNEYFRLCDELFSKLKTRTPCESILEDYFYDYDKDNSGKLNFKEFKKLMKHMIKDHKKSAKKHGRKYSSGDDYSDFSN